MIGPRSIKIVFLLIAASFWSCSTGNEQAYTLSEQAIVMDLQALLEGEEYFKFDSFYTKHSDELSRRDKLYFGGMLNSMFSSHKQSNEQFRKLKRKYGEKLTDKEQLSITKAMRMNYFHLYDYGHALSCNLELITKYEYLIDSVELYDLRNDQRILEALQNAPKQEIILTKDVDIEYINDNWGSMLVSADFYTFDSDFIFDTGFSMSCMTRSLAEKSGYKILKVGYEVAGATGEKALCDVVVADSFALANITILNAVFWVFDDADLSLPEYEFYVNGVIGMPILKSLGEMRISLEGHIKILKEPLNYHLRNLAFTDLDPVIAVIQNKDTLPFYFDTGSSLTEFYMPYYKKFESEVRKKFDIHKYKVGSLGGVKEFSYYLADTSILEVGGSTATLFDKGIHTHYIYDDPEKVYGNLGSDFLRQFQEMVISFSSNSVFFE